jgi:hypothetical protein
MSIRGAIVLGRLGSSGARKAASRAGQGSDVESAPGQVRSQAPARSKAMSSVLSSGGSAARHGSRRTDCLLPKSPQSEAMDPDAVRSRCDLSRKPRSFGSKTQGGPNGSDWLRRASSDGITTRSLRSAAASVRAAPEAGRPLDRWAQALRAQRGEHRRLQRSGSVGSARARLPLRSTLDATGPGIVLR